MFEYEHKTKNKYKSIAVIGLGTLGSNIAYFIAKKRIAEKLLIIDHDIVEEKNTTNQLYDPQDVGKKKILVMRQKLKEYCNVEAIDTKINPETISIIKDVDVVIDTTDNLNTAETIMEHKAGKKLIITKIRGTYAMIGFANHSHYERLHELIKNKNEAKELSALPVRFEASAIIASITAYVLAYEQLRNELWFLDLKDFGKIIKKAEY